MEKLISGSKLIQSKQRLFAFMLITSSMQYNINYAYAEAHSSPPNYPYFITTQPLTIRNIAVPVGTKLTYEKMAFKKGMQSKPLSENKLTGLDFPPHAQVNWGSVPITSIQKFFNSEMKGYSVYADFAKLSINGQTSFSKLWQSCNDDLGITVKNTNDWSFNKNNIVDVQSCSVNYQRYFKDDPRQNKFLDEIYKALQNVKVK